MINAKKMMYHPHSGKQGGGSYIDDLFNRLWDLAEVTKIPLTYYLLPEGNRYSNDIEKKNLIGPIQEVHDYYAYVLTVPATERETTDILTSLLPKEGTNQNIYIPRDYYRDKDYYYQTVKDNEGNKVSSFNYRFMTEVIENLTIKDPSFSDGFVINYYSDRNVGKSMNSIFDFNAEKDIDFSVHNTYPFFRLSKKFLDMGLFGFRNIESYHRNDIGYIQYYTGPILDYYLSNPELDELKKLDTIKNDIETFKGFVYWDRTLDSGSPSNDDRILLNPINNTTQYNALGRFRAHEIIHSLTNIYPTDNEHTYSSGLIHLENRFYKFNEPITKNDFMHIKVYLENMKYAIKYVHGLE